MDRIGVGIDQGDRERFNALRDEVLQVPPQRRFVKRDSDVATGVDPFFRFTCVFDCCWRVRLDHNDPAGQRPGRPGAGEVQDLLEPCGSDEADLGAFAFEHGVSCHSGAVHDVSNRCG